jgi:hypothetical protein
MYASRQNHDAGVQTYFRELFFHNAPHLRHSQPSTDSEWDEFISQVDHYAKACNWSKIGLAVNSRSIISLATPLERFALDSFIPGVVRLALCDSLVPPIRISEVGVHKPIRVRQEAEAKKKHPSIAIFVVFYPRFLCQNGC